MRRLTVPERHQLRIARDTLKLSDVGARVFGGPTKDEARETVRRLTTFTGRKRSERLLGFGILETPRQGK